MWTVHYLMDEVCYVARVRASTEKAVWFWAQHALPGADVYRVRRVGVRRHG